MHYEHEAIGDILANRDSIAIGQNVRIHGVVLL